MLQRNHSHWILIIIGALILVGLFMLPRINNPNKEIVARFKDADIACMGGHARAVQHFHPKLTITVDGQEETVPANIGLLNNCMAEIHMHDATGTLHIESSDADKPFYLKQFFVVFGQPLEREGYTLTMTVDGQRNTDLGELMLKDKQEIVLEYKSKQ